MTDSNSIIQTFLAQIETDVLKAEIERREKGVKPKKVSITDSKKQYYKSRLLGLKRRNQG